MVIHYKAGYLQTRAIFYLRGSVFPRACWTAIPTALLATILSFLIDRDEIGVGFIKNPAAYTSFTFVVGFLLVFRNQTAYSRFWEGATLMQVLRGQWVGAFGSLLAFSSESLNSEDQILEFRLKLIRLFSALHASSLDYIYGEPDGSSKIIGIDGLDDSTLKLMNQADDESLIYVIIQWIQQMILHNCSIGVIPTPAPIVSRVFQDLSSGMVTVNNAKKISDTPFPFPYCQALQVALLMHAVVTPIVFVQLVTHPLAAGGLTFAAVILFQTLNHISSIIEHPFGQDLNDIDKDELHTRFNKTLVTMLSPGASKRPRLRCKLDNHDIMKLPEMFEHAEGYSKVWERIKPRRDSFHNTTVALDMRGLFQNFDEPGLRQYDTTVDDSILSKKEEKTAMKAMGKLEGKTVQSKASGVPSDIGTGRASSQGGESDLEGMLERKASESKAADVLADMDTEKPSSLGDESDPEGDVIQGDSSEPSKSLSSGRQSRKARKKSRAGASSIAATTNYTV